MIHWYRESVIGTGRSPALWLMIGFLVTFGITRLITLKIRAKNSSGTADEGGAKDVFIGGVHIHRQVWGILLLFVMGTSPMIVMGLVGLPARGLSFVSAIHVAKPRSYWAQRPYGEKNLAKSERRFGVACAARREALRDFSGALNR